MEKTLYENLMDMQIIEVILYSPGRFQKSLTILKRFWHLLMSLTEFHQKQNSSSLRYIAFPERKDVRQKEGEYFTTLNRATFDVHGKGLSSSVKIQNKFLKDSFVFNSISEK